MKSDSFSFLFEPGQERARIILHELVAARYGPGHPLAEAIEQATEPAALEAAARLFNTLPSRTRRKLIASLIHKLAPGRIEP